MSNIIRKFLTRNPFNNQILKEFQFLTNSELLDKLRLSVEGFKKYSKVSCSERSQRLAKLGSLLESNPEKIAKLITLEMGKPISQSIAEVKKSASICQYYADNLERLLKNEIVQTEARKCYIRFEPMGTIFMITPFNFPFYLTFKGAIANLALGNVLMVRPADSTPQVGLIIEEIMKEAGYVNNEFQNVFTTIEQTDLLLSKNEVKGVSFTGSSFAGGKIGQIAGKYVKKSVMELGGSDPFIVVKNADPEFAANLAVKSRSANCGQVCLSAKRFLIDESVYDDFVKKLISKLQQLKIGDPMNPDTQMGPMARDDLREGIDKQVQQSIKEGGKLLYGGKKIETPELKDGYFYEPTVIECKNENNIVCREETFGPVFAILKTKSVEEQIRIANNSDFGLGAVVVSQDLELAEKIAEQLECGLTFVNEIVKSDARYPSGGVKYSGFGRECADFGIKEFANIKSVWIN